MVETMCATNDTMIIAGCKQPTTLVRERFAKINDLHIQYVFDGMKSNTRKERNIKKYLLAVLFNAPSTTAIGAVHHNEKGGYPHAGGHRAQIGYIGHKGSQAHGANA